MGQLIYASRIHVFIEDDTLAHIEAVMGAKFRLNQPFYFSWNHTVHTGESHMSIWLNPTTAVEFHYLCATKPRLNRGRVAAMLNQANSAAGLSICLAEIVPSQNLTPAA
ncbi:hypothetical protein PA27867_4007 (plasmid) [Cryobacterium arcticum]|uniref:DUF7882 domain-containing protein n=2 Tax=Cryobacterium arcticum TaxID=670052 RepID=A0A1B1BR89_9MICO|nr:hypothetical protein PA27867_4007 [Cryobacterium arcticum]